MLVEIKIKNVLQVVSVDFTWSNDCYKFDFYQFFPVLSHFPLISTVFPCFPCFLLFPRVFHCFPLFFPCFPLLSTIFTLLFLILRRGSRPLWSPWIRLCLSDERLRHNLVQWLQSTVCIPLEFYELPLMYATITSVLTLIVLGKGGGAC